MVMWNGSYSIGNQSGPVFIGDNIYTSYADCYDLENAMSTMYVISLEEGTVESEIDLSDWWSDTASLEIGARLTGGPGGIEEERGLLLMNSNGSCIRHLIDPLADEDEMTLWVNRNGDYVLDKNWGG